MKKVFGYALALFFGFALGVVLTSDVFAGEIHPATAVVTPTTNAAYRDGLFNGQHDAQEGRANHVAVGRWSADQDRAQYQAGYDAGFTGSN